MVNKSCICDECISYCKTKPGWFLPGEIEMVSEYLGMSLKDLFNEYLSVDWFLDDDDLDLYPITPAIIGHYNRSGKMFTFNPIGVCIFLVDNRCSIHEVKPYECRDALHGADSQYIRGRHREIARAWKNSKQQSELLGHKAHPIDQTESDNMMGYPSGHNFFMDQ